MSTFLLIHGAWHGAWCWAAVEQRLTAAGHKVVAPTLVGLAERRAELHAGVGLLTHLEQMRELIVTLDLQNLVLCAHSYGGMLARGLVDNLRSRIAKVLYLDAYLPKPGQCGLDLRSPENNEKLLAGLREGWLVPAPPAESFGIPEKLRAEFDSRLTPMSLACFTQPLPLTYTSLTSPPSAYLRTAWPREPLDQAYEKFAELGLTAERWDCSHDVMLERPLELSSFLERFAR